MCEKINSGTRRRIEIFQKRKMFRIEFPEILAWFQTPQTVSRPSRPDFQPRKTNSGTRRPIEIFKKRKMIRIEFPKLLAWFQTHQTVSRPSRPSRPLVPDTSDRFQTVQTRFFLSCFCSESRSFLMEKKSKRAVRCPFNTVLSTTSYFDITDEGSYIDTGALLSKPSSFHLPLQLPLPHEVVPHVDEVTLHWSRKLRNHILDRRLSR